MIAIIDYGAGNIKSVSKALEKIGQESIVTSKADEINKCSGIILPGVGSFGIAMQNIKDLKLDQCIKANIDEGKLFLGICLGMQLLFDRSYEDGVWAGLGILGGEIIRFSDNTLKVPHMGWNRLQSTRQDPINNGIADGEYAYFVHSYYALPKDWHDVICYTDYGVQVPAVVRKNNVIGMQFHPEKSSETGIKLLKNFIKEVKESENDYISSN
jgi:glutamine amidotransferase